MAITFTTIKGDKDICYGYRGFRIFRVQLAHAMDEELGKLYGDTIMLLRQPDEFNRRFNEIVSREKFQNQQELVDFLCMSDCSGKIPARVCKQIVAIHPEKDDELIELMKFCIKNKRKLVWH